ncbi:hypothetical protein P5F56_06230 [Clostridium perfringens]|nr:hypothetical protein [Clostridium perfringens]
MEELIKIMDEIGLTYAYDHFAEGESPAPPFICYLLPQDDNFAADGIVYYKISGVRIELYTDYKNPDMEEKVTAVLDSHGIFYAKNEVWIEDEKLYEVAFEFELPV